MLFQHSVFGNGGAVIQDSSYRIASTVGQPVIGKVEDSSHIMSVGFWYLLLPTEPIPAPVISLLNPTHGPVGTPVTITGEHFGASQDSSTVTFNGIEATNITVWSDTQIVAVVPTGATTGPVVVTVDGRASNSDKIFTVDSPEDITLWLNPEHQVVSVGQELTLQVKIESGLKINGVSVFLTHDSSFLEVVDTPPFTPGDFLPLPPTTTIAENSASGSQLNYVQFGLIEGNSGQGTIASVKFKALKEGTVHIQFDFDSQNHRETAVSSSEQPGSITPNVRSATVDMVNVTSIPV